MSQNAPELATWSPQSPGGTVRALGTAGLSARAGFGVVGVVAVAVAALILVPLYGLLPVLRLPAVVVPSAVAIVCLLRPWRDREWLRAWAAWEPSARVVIGAACVLAALLAWAVLSRFHAGEINALDFTVYFDRPCFQTASGNPYFVEATDDLRFSYQSQLLQHAYWGLGAVCAPYWVQPSPYWLLALTAVLPVIGALFIYRISRRLGAGGPLAAAVALSYVLGDNMARGVNYGFHPELFYACLIPWMLDAGLRRAWRTYLLAGVMMIAVKEDAVFGLLGVATALMLVAGRLSRLERVWISMPTLMGLANLAFYYGVFLPPRLASSPLYLEFWSGLGSTPFEIVESFAQKPFVVLWQIVQSPFWGTVMLPFLFLPCLGWRWVIGIVPVVALYASSSAPQLREFSLYYSIVLVPFLALGGCAGALKLARRWPDYRQTQVVLAVLVTAGALLVGAGSRGYSFRPWRGEVMSVRSVGSVIQDEGPVLVQSSLFPHVGYDDRYRLLTPATLDDADYAGATLVLAPELGAFPFDTRRLLSHPAVTDAQPLENGLVLARIGR